MHAKLVRYSSYVERGIDKIQEHLAECRGCTEYVCRHAGLSAPGFALDRMEFVRVHVRDIRDHLSVCVLCRDYLDAHMNSGVKAGQMHLAVFG